MAASSPHRLVVAPFTESNLYKLGYSHNWPELRRILGLMPGNVTNGCSQSIVDDTRRRFDLCLGGVPTKYSVLHNVADRASDEGAALLLELLLSIGLDPDLSTSNGWRPSHMCAHQGFLRATRAVLLCRPDMAAKNVNGDTPLGAAAHAVYEGDDDAPYQVAEREDVERFIRSEGLDLTHRTLPELAVRKVWFAVKNLIRRQVVPASEFQEKAYGKTAVEWAEFFNEKGIAAELQYYASLPSAQLLDAKEKIQNFENEVDDLKDQLKRQRSRASSEKEAAAAKAKAESDALREQLKGLEERCAAFETKNGELSETLATLTSSRSPGETSELSGKEPDAKRTKVETAGSVLRSGEDESSNTVE